MIKACNVKSDHWRKSQLCHLACMSLSTDLISLRVGFFICKMRITEVFTELPRSLNRLARCLVHKKYQTTSALIPSFLMTYLHITCLGQIYSAKWATQISKSQGTAGRFPQAPGKCHNEVNSANREVNWRSPAQSPSSVSLSQDPDKKNKSSLALCHCVHTSLLKPGPVWSYADMCSLVDCELEEGNQVFFSIFLLLICLVLYLQKS